MYITKKRKKQDSKFSNDDFIPKIHIYIVDYILCSLVGN